MKKIYSLLFVLVLSLSASAALLPAPHVAKNANVELTKGLHQMAGKAVAGIRRAPSSTNAVINANYFEAAYWGSYTGDTEDWVFFLCFSPDQYSANMLLYLDVYGGDETHVCGNYDFADGSIYEGQVVAAAGDTAALVSGQLSVTYDAQQGYYFVGNFSDGSRSFDINCYINDFYAYDAYYAYYGYDMPITLDDANGTAGGGTTSQYDFSYESTTATTINRTYSANEVKWDAQYYATDGDVDLVLTAADGSDKAAFYFYVPSYDNNQVPAGTYTIDYTGAPNTVGASEGIYSTTTGTYIIPAYYGVRDADGYISDVWFLVSGTVTVSYNAAGQQHIVVNALSANGSTINITVDNTPDNTSDALEDIDASSASKFVEDGQIVILKNGTRYNALGAVIE